MNTTQGVIVSHRIQKYELTQRICTRRKTEEQKGNNDQVCTIVHWGWRYQGKYNAQYSAPLLQNDYICSWTHPLILQVSMINEIGNQHPEQTILREMNQTYPVSSFVPIYYNVNEPECCTKQPDKIVCAPQVQHLQAGFIIGALIVPVIFLWLVSFASIDAAAIVKKAITNQLAIQSDNDRNRFLCSTLVDTTSLPTDLVHIIVLFDRENLVCNHRLFKRQQPLVKVEKENSFIGVISE
jgi:hypothetical protein